MEAVPNAPGILACSRSRAACLPTMEAGLAPLLTHLPQQLGTGLPALPPHLPQHGLPRVAVAVGRVHMEHGVVEVGVCVGPANDGQGHIRSRADFGFWCSSCQGVPYQPFVCRRPLSLHRCKCLCGKCLLQPCSLLQFG